MKGGKNGKIKAGYRREMNHNYMIIEAFSDDTECYESRMLSGNTIEGLLKFRQKITETGIEFYYEITSKQPLSRLLEGRLISYEEIKEILLAAARVLSRIEEFLLKGRTDPSGAGVYLRGAGTIFYFFPVFSQVTAEVFRRHLQVFCSIFWKKWITRTTEVLCWHMGFTMKA